MTINKFMTYETHVVIYDVISEATFDDLDVLFTEDFLNESLVAQYVLENLKGVEDIQSFLDEVDSETIMDSIMEQFETQRLAQNELEVEYLEDL